MARNRRFPRAQRLSLGQQRAQMMAVWPALDTHVEGGLLVVRGTVQPSPITQAYGIRVTYRDGGVPKAFVVAPALARRPAAPDTPIPHTYNALTVGEERPCLYFPSAREWRSEMAIATTIMPWLLTWLVDYELWHATGEWMGGGVAHTGPKSPDEPPPGEAAA